ncbi:MAG: alpha/beta fold hydrolase [bacterium]|nr:alpha/beta fold hydrolase [bacterium]
MKTVLALVIACLLFAPSVLSAQDTPSDRYTIGEDFTVEPCPPEAEGFPLSITCGYLSVPENRTHPDSRTIQIAVAIVHTLTPDPQTPLVVLGGGPGDPLLLGMLTLPMMPQLAAGLALERDVIFVEQRGVGYSRPRLVCDDLISVYYGDEQAVRACFDKLTAEGADLTGYNSVEAAADVAALRVALGVEEWNILGLSYGTRWALTIARNHPEGIRSLVLDGVFPPQIDFNGGVRTISSVLDQVLAACASDAACNAAYPDLSETLRATITRLNDSPLTVNGEAFTGDVLAAWLFRSAYRADRITLIPALIAAAATGDVLSLEANNPIPRAELELAALGVAAYLSVNCNEEIAFSSLDELMSQVNDADPLVAAIGRNHVQEYTSCAIWQSGTADAVENTPVTSDIPTLILNGEFDPTTPVGDGYLAAETLSNVSVLDFPGQGHGMIFSECAVVLMHMFLNTLDGASLETSCIAQEYGAPAFVLPGTPSADESASAQLSDALQQYADATFSAGSTAAIAVQVTVGDETLRAVVGSRDGTVPAEPGDRFRIGSMSKTFVAATAFRMAEDGLLNLDALAAEYLPDDVVNQIANLDGSDGVTVRQLLAMQSGIPDYLATSTFQAQLRADPDFSWTAADALTYAYGLPALFAPGDNVSYSNTNYLLAQLVMEQAGGAPLHELIRSYILDPLNLDDTYSQSFETLADSAESTLVVGYHDWDGDGVPEDVSAINDGFGLGDGGLISTTQDITTFYRALLIDQTLLTADSLAQMMTFADGDDDVYGVGLDQWDTEFGPAIGHSGGVLGFLSLGVVLPDANLMIVVLCATTECVPEDIAQMVAVSLDSILSASPSADHTDLSTALQSQMDEEIAANPIIPGQLLTVIAPEVGIDVDLAAGVVDFASGSPLEPGAAFRIASVTKTFTAAAVLRLVEMGEVDLDASIEQYVSDESIAILQADGYVTDAITVRQLLLHTSGIADFSAGNPAYFSAVLGEPERVWTQPDQVQFAVDTADPVGDPGAQYSYSDTGYILLGELIERQTGQNLGAAVRALLDYERLGMTNTYWERLESVPDRLEMSHQYFGDVDITESLDPSVDLFGGGGLVSTSRDLAVFFRALLRGEVFEQAQTLETMLTIPETNRGVQDGMDAGMGIFRISGDGLTCWTHGGFWGVIALYCPDLDIAIARSINQANQQNVSLLSLVNPALIYVMENAS